MLGKNEEKKDIEPFSCHSSLYFLRERLSVKIPRLTARQIVLACENVTELSQQAFGKISFSEDISPFGAASQGILLPHSLTKQNFGLKSKVLCCLLF